MDSCSVCQYIAQNGPLNPTLSNRAAAREIGCDESSVRRHFKHGPRSAARTLVIDIEYQPGTAYVWGAVDRSGFIPNIRMLTEPRLLCFAAKWLGEKDVVFRSRWEDGTQGMADTLYELLEEAHVVVTYNGDRYDLPKIAGELFRHKSYRPAKPKSIDLMKAVKKLGLTYNSLEYISGVTDLGHKLSHSGFSLWTGVMDGNEADREMMREYNIQDILLTEALYLAMQGWIPNHPNMALMGGESDEGKCPVCLTDEYERTEKDYAADMQAYAQYRCVNGHLFRTREITHKVSRKPL